jgi:hypothetical protein
MSGVERPATEPSDLARAIAGVLLYLPRTTVDLLFLASGTAAGLVHDQQVVPRIADMVSPEEGEIGVFPTLFAETGRGRFSVGARMIANLGSIATGLRAGYGGPDEHVIETRLRFSRSDPLPATFSLEAFYDRRTDLEYLGVGQVPEDDARNRFAPGAITSEALYREQRARAIGSFGVRPAPDLELFLSTSFSRRRVDDPEGAGAAALSRVFAPGSVPGAFTETPFAYTEVALRADTREARARPSPGALVEMYGGISTGGAGLAEDTIWLARAGGRVAAFVPIVRRSNILSPQLVVDGVAPLAGVLPFTELARQPDFRGHDTRRDRLSVVGSIDYRWAVLRYVAARIFLDTATVAPHLAALSLEHLRFAAGFGADVASASTEIGRVALSFSPEGARLLLSLGVPSPFGDRQHRE